MLAGTLVIADIGIPAAVVMAVDGPWVELLTKDSMRALVPPRAQQSHKGDYGHVLVVAGSPGKTGAAVLAGPGGAAIRCRTGDGGGAGELSFRSSCRTARNS